MHFIINILFLSFSFSFSFFFSLAAGKVDLPLHCACLPHSSKRKTSNFGEVLLTRFMLR